MNIYVMNLDSSLKRWLDIKKQAEKYNLNLIRVKPVTFTDPHFLSLRESWDIKHSAELSLQLTVTRICDRENKPFLLLEDDIYFDEDPTIFLSNLPDNFTLAYIGGYLKDRKELTIHGFHSVIINPDKCKDFLEIWKYKKIIAHDGWCSTNILRNSDYNCYISNRFICWQKADMESNSIHGKFRWEYIKEESLKKHKEIFDKIKNNCYNNNDNNYFTRI